MRQLQFYMMAVCLLLLAACSAAPPGSGSGYMDANGVEAISEYEAAYGDAAENRETAAYEGSIKNEADEAAFDAYMDAEGVQTEPTYDGALEGGIPADDAGDWADGGIGGFMQEAKAVQRTVEMALYPDEAYTTVVENAALSPAEVSEAAFALTVDSSSYRNVARYIDNGYVPPASVVRTDEMVNYFQYETPLTATDTFTVYTELGPSPFDAQKRLAFVRLKATDADNHAAPPNHIVLVIDNSASMRAYDKWPLLQTALYEWVGTLNENDKVTVVAPGGAVLEGASGDETQRITDALTKAMEPSAEKISAAYETVRRLAEQYYIPGEGGNRVIVATDDVSETAVFQALADEAGIGLTVLALGAENRAVTGEGAVYIDAAATATRTLTEALAGRVYAIAYDAYARLVFNPAQVAEYRLIGYEDNALSNRDDANRFPAIVAAGTDVVVLCEITLVDDAGDADVYDLDNWLFAVRVDYTDTAGVRRQFDVPVYREQPDTHSDDFIFAAAVAGLGHLLRGSLYTGALTASDVLEMATAATGLDADGKRRAFVETVTRYLSATAER